MGRHYRSIIVIASIMELVCSILTRQGPALLYTEAQPTPKISQVVLGNIEEGRMICYSVMKDIPFYR